VAYNGLGNLNRRLCPGQPPCLLDLSVDAHAGEFVPVLSSNLISGFLTKGVRPVLS